MKPGTKRHTPDEAFQKLMKYCTYQERCHEEVRSKLISLKVYGDDLERVISRLIEHDFLNEERYAKLYAGSKFRQLHWGRTKITAQLKFRKISEYCIREAMKEIDETAYLRTLRELIKKRKPARGFDPATRSKTAQYLISRGFESPLVWQELGVDDD